MPLIRSVHVGARALSFATLTLCLPASAIAQARSPFGVGISEGGGSPVGITGWLLAQQSWFEQQLSAGVRAAAHDGTAVWWLAGLGFIYGVFHAAGPGHGKAVLASYMVANERALRRGIALSLVAALLQGAVAVALVACLAMLLHATAASMKMAATLVEFASFAGVTCLGAWLVWRKGKVFLDGIHRRASRRTGGNVDRAFGALQTAFGSLAPDKGARLAFSASPAASAGRFVCIAPEPSHPADCLCHTLDPALLSRPDFSWREAGLTVLAAGARPCSGAILVLVFALVQGVFPAGIAAVAAMSLGVAITTGALASLAVLAKSVALRLSRAGSDQGRLLLSGLELAAALLVFFCGSALLAGYAAVG